jgi:cytochrome bd ubiquinol oxidase subunit I
VTGTVLSFEMGLLWPGLMRQYGAVLGFPFGVEGLFFFLEGRPVVPWSCRMRRAG